MEFRGSYALLRYYPPEWVICSGEIHYASLIARRSCLAVLIIRSEFLDTQGLHIRLPRYHIALFVVRGFGHRMISHVVHSDSPVFPPSPTQEEESPVSMRRRLRYVRTLQPLALRWGVRTTSHREDKWANIVAHRSPNLNHPLSLPPGKVRRRNVRFTRLFRRPSLPHRRIADR